MKSVNFAIFSLRAVKVAAIFAVAGAAISAQAATTNGTATATVVRPIAIAAVKALAFGSFVPNAAGGVAVTMPTTGSRTLGTGVLNVTSTTSAASFDVTGEGGLAYTVTLPTTATITHSTDTTKTMTVKSFVSNLTNNIGTLSGTGGSAGAQTVLVGATLETVASQTTGTYSGTFPVQVEYN